LNRQRARTPFVLTPQLFEISDAQLAIEAAVVDMGRRSDSIGLGITLYRRAVVPPCPEGWVRLGMSKDAVDTGSYDGIEMWSSFRLRAPKARPTKSVDSLVRSAKRMLESMNSCELDAHRGATTAPWCWAGPGRVSVVPGVLRARLSAGEDITMSMSTNRIPGGRGRYCIYSAGGRISSS